MATLGGVSNGLGNGGLGRSPFSRRLESKLLAGEPVVSDDLMALADLAPGDVVVIEGRAAVLGEKFLEGSERRVYFSAPGRPSEVFSVPLENGVEFLSRPQSEPELPGPGLKTF
jgi:hypothetical protein